MNPSTIIKVGMEYITRPNQKDRLELWVVGVNATVCCLMTEKCMALQRKILAH